MAHIKTHPVTAYLPVVKYILIASSLTEHHHRHQMIRGDGRVHQSIDIHTIKISDIVYLSIFQPVSCTISMSTSIFPSVYHNILSIDRFLFQTFLSPTSPWLYCLSLNLLISSHKHIQAISFPFYNFRSHFV